MKRRSYLATLSVAALAGCTGTPAGSGGDTTENPDTTADENDTTADENDATTDDETTTRDNRTTTGGTFPYAIDTVRTSEPPVDDVTMDATVTRHFSTDRPARLEVSFTNDAEEPRTFAFGSLVPWDGLWGDHESRDATLLLAPSDEVVPDEPSDGCWQATDGVGLPEVMREETIDAGETVSGEFAVLAAHDSPDCHPQGTYRFEKEHYLEEGWWFELDIVPVVED